jgi:hypothetical protein
MCHKFISSVNLLLYSLRTYHNNDGKTFISMICTTSQLKLTHTLYVAKKTCVKSKLNN